MTNFYQLSINFVSILYTATNMESHTTPTLLTILFKTSFFDLFIFLMNRYN